MRLEYVTHASLLLSTGGICLLTDPFYFHDELSGSFNCFFPPRELTPDGFPQLDYVYCSHIHDDHCHQHTMELLRDKIKTILLPAGRQDLEAKIRGYGFTEFIFLENEVSLDLPGGIRLTCYHDPNRVDSALVIQAEGKTILNQNDCRLDLDGFGRMAARFKIDYAFFPHRGNQGLYPFLLPRPEAVIDDLSEVCEREEMDYFVECLRILRPSLVIPYSFTVFYSNDDQLKYNGYHRNRPPDFKKRMEAEIPGLKCLVIQPGDAFEGEGEWVFRPAGTQDYWGRDLEDFLRLGREYCRHLPDTRRHFDFGSVEGVAADLREYLQARIRKPLPDYFARETVVVHVADAQGVKRSFYIQAGKQRVLESAPEGIPFLEITVPASLIGAFLERKYDSFMILYSYRIRFQCNALMLLGMNPEQECYFYVRAAIALFDFETYSLEFSAG